MVGRPLAQPVFSLHRAQSLSLRNTASSLFHLVSAQALGRLLTALMLPFTLRVMPAEEYAGLGLYAAVAQMLGILTAGIDSASGRLAREEFVRESSIARTLAASLGLRLPLVLLTLAGMVLFQRQVLGFTHLPPAGWWMLAATVVFANMTAVTQILLAQERFALASWLSQAPVFLNAAAALAVIFHLAPPRGIVLVAGFFAGTLVVAAGNAWAVRGHWRGLRLDGAWARRLALLSMPLLLNGVSVFLLDYADFLVVRGVMPLTQVGIYGAALTLAAYLRLPVQTLSTLIMPRITGHFLDGGTDRVRWFYGRILPQMVFCMTQLVCGIICCSPLLGLVVGPRFAPVEGPFKMLAAGLGPLLITWTLTPLFYASQRIGYHVAAYIIMGAAGVALALLWTPELGMTGAALARLCADITGCLLHVLAAARLGYKAAGALLWTWPAWLVLPVAELGVGRWLAPLCWMATLAASVALARGTKLFDEESAGFLRGLGLPGWILRPALLIHRRILAPPA